MSRHHASYVRWRRVRALVSMRKISVLLAGVAAAACSDMGGEPIDIEQQSLVRACGSTCSKWVFPSVFSRDLIYVPDLEGDQLPDFSRVGYRGGATGLLSEQLPPTGSEGLTDITPGGWASLAGSCMSPPESLLAPPTDTSAPGHICNPGAFDHGAVIQCLIDRVAAQPGPHRGRVYLPRGHYAIHRTLELKEGVVLVGQSPNGPGAPTALHLCGNEDRLIEGTNGGDVGTLEGPAQPIVDDVPSGANSVRVGLNHGFVAGRMVRILRTPCPLNEDEDDDQPTAAELQASCPKLWQWTQDVGMDEGWLPSQIEFQRYITHVQPAEDQAGNIVGSRIFLDIPLTNALESKYGPHTIQQYAANDRPTGVHNMGVMSIRGVSHMPATCDALSDESQCTGQNAICCVSQTMIWLHSAVDSWVYNVVAEGFSMSAVTFGPRSRFNTVENVSYIDPHGVIDGGYRYPFHNGGQMNLIARVFSSKARHDHAGGGWVPGPNVVVESDAMDSIQDSGPHHRWGTGILYDNLKLHSWAQPPIQHFPSAARIEARDRGTSGESGDHGWTGANIVAWNTYANGGYEYYSPPTAQNWLIGNTGGPVGTTLHSNGSPAHGGPSNMTAGSLFSTVGGAPPDSTIGSSLYRTSAYVYGPSSLGNDELEVRQYFIGDIDNFTSESGDTVNDSVFVDPPFVTWLATTLAPTTVKGLDYTLTSNNTSAAVSVPVSIRYDLATDQTVTMAYLAMNIRRVGSWTSNADHFIQIAGVGTQNSHFSDSKTYYWQCGSGTPADCQVIPPDFTGPIGWSTSAGSSGPPGTSVVRVLELPESTFGALLNRTRTTTAGRRFGELNLNFAKKTRVDWLRLALVVRRTIPG